MGSLPISAAASFHYLFKPPYAILSVPTFLSHHTDRFIIPVYLVTNTGYICYLKCSAKNGADIIRKSVLSGKTSHKLLFQEKIECEHPPVREEKMSKRLGGIKGCK